MPERLALLDLHAHALGGEHRLELAGALRPLLRHRQDAHLLGCEPRRKGAAVVLDQPTDEALHGAEQRAVDDDGRMRLIVRSDVRELEALGHLEVELKRASLPFAADRVHDVDVDLGAVEGPAPLVDHVVHAATLQDAAQRLRGLVVDRRVADRLVRSRRQGDVVLVAEDAQQIVGQVEQAVVLVRDLVRPHEDVGVVLREAADAQHPVQGAAALVPVAGPKLREAQRQVAVRPRARPIDHEVVGAVHRLHAEARPLVVHRREHVLLEDLQVPADLVELLARDLG